MPESPPKRVTRARAAKADETKAPTSRAKKAATAAKISETATTAENVIKSAPRRTKTSTANAAIEVVPAAETSVAEPRKTRGRPKKATEPQVNEVAAAQPTKSRSRAKAVAVDVVTEPPAPTTRSKRTVSRSGNQAVTEAEGSAQGPKKTTRTRGAAAAAGAAPAKPVTTRKKVTFEEQAEQNKENQPTLSKGSKLGTVGEKAAGLKAKPIRRAASVRTTRGRKATPEDSPKASAVQPLSPKKVTQVAKSISSGSEDEVVAIQTPTKSLKALPLKSSGASQEIGDNAMEMLSSGLPPTAANAILASPARRPPQPMFKDAMKESPKRWNGLAGSAQSPSQASPLRKDSSKESPKRVNFPASQKTQAVNLSHSPLKSSLNESPRRVNFLVDPAPSASSTSQSPFKTSLLQSPPKRLLSPVKTFGLTSPGKSSMVVPVLDAYTASKEVSTFKLPTLTPQKLFTAHESTLAERESFWPETHRESSANDFHEDDESTSAGPRPVTPLVELATHCSLSEDQIEDVVMGGTTPPGVQAKMETGTTILSTYRNAEDSDSEDELTSGENTGMTSPRRKSKVAVFDFATHVASTPPLPTATVAAVNQAETPMFVRSSYEHAQESSLSMTPLAVQLSSWQASSPDKRRIEKSASKAQGIFSLAKLMPSGQHTGGRAHCSMTPEKSTFFDEEMAVRDQEHLTLQPAVEERAAEERAVEELARAEAPAQTDNNEPSQESEEYGDENAVPIDPRLFSSHEAAEPVAVITPARIFQSRPHEIHTVSKVPLRAPASDSPLHIPRKRSRSVTAPLTELTGLARPSFLPDNRCENDGADADDSPESAIAVPATPAKAVRFSADMDKSMGTPSNNPVSAYGTPFRAARLGPDAEILRGAVVFVNVYTTEGADASGIFVELLTQMGARCVKQWNWNPRPSTAQPDEMLDDASAPFNTKVGITHVVFKDGGKRTLHKVRESKGLVLCVGVGWVLDCERENRWLNEADYAIDTSTIPRGGHNRRKSMEPRLLANVNGTLVPTAPSTRSVSNVSPTKEFLDFGTPAAREPTAVAISTPETPTADLAPVESLSSWPSPTTPYFLAQGAALVQQTCPPKQIMEPLFPRSGRIADQPDEAVRRRLLMARRKSLQWAPKVGSPLGRDLS